MFQFLALRRPRPTAVIFLVQSQHVYVYGAYVYYLGTRLRVKPSILFRATKAAIATDVNFNINIDTKYLAGVFLRNFKSYGVLLPAWAFNKFRFGCAFELPTGSSAGPQFISHELYIGSQKAILNSHERSFSEF